jgi:replication-associated recombination protein RarA
VGEDSALFWATELDLSRYGEYAMKRLCIIASEDVGMGEPHVPETFTRSIPLGPR